MHTVSVMELVVVLSGAVVKTAFKLWTGDNSLADNVAGDLTDLIKPKVVSVLDQRKVRRQFEQMEDLVARRVLATMGEEFRGLAENERNSAIIAVAETFDRAKLTDQAIFANNLDPLYLEKFIRQFIDNDLRDLSYGGIQLYDRVLGQCCAFVIEIADKLPSFQAGAFAELLKRDDHILARLGEVLERLPSPAVEAAGADRVETAYRQRIAKIFDRLELFGLDFVAQWYSLSIAYVNLKLSIEHASQAAAAPDAISIYQGDKLDAWLAAYPRLLIDGSAGGGKTTILQWIAVRAARRDFKGMAAQFNGYVPFFIRLREYVGSSLPQPEQFMEKVAPLLAPEAGTWPREQLRAGRALVLVDGMDEIPEPQRPAVITWLRELTDLFPTARYIVTTRPNALESDALSSERFVTALLDPMEPALIRQFIDKWHTAMREWQRDTESDARLAVCRNELLRTLGSSRFIGDLASTPLLAGLVCALNHHLDGQLPRRRGEIFEKALTMFYERDHKRGVTTAITIDQAATYHLLGDVALWMVRNGAIEVPISSVQEVLSRSASSLRNGPDDASALYRHLLLRSGLLREPTSGHVDFTHRTFQEYLAARALIGSDNVGEIIKNASDDQWREIVILAAGQGNKRQTTDLLRGLLRSTWRGKSRYRRRLLAVASLDEVRGADPKLLAEIDRAIPELLPPRTIEQAEALSHAGEGLIPHLAIQISGMTGEEALSTIRAASLIGGPEALSLVSRVAFKWKDKINHRNSAWLRAELMRAWQYFDPKLYAFRVLAPIQINRVTVTGAQQIKAIHGISSITTLVVSGFVPPEEELSLLHDMRIRAIELKNCPAKSLTEIIDKSWPTIERLRLNGCAKLSDILAISYLDQVREIQIYDCPLVGMPGWGTLNMPLYVGKIAFDRWIVRQELNGFTAKSHI